MGNTHRPIRNSGRCRRPQRRELHRRVGLHCCRLRFPTASRSTPTAKGAALPTVSSVSPATGTTSGGTAVTITGTGFVAGATVEIGQGSGAGAGAIPRHERHCRLSPTEISAVTGGGAKAGTWSLFVTTPAGTSAANSGDDFTYAAPTVTTVGPKPGPPSGWPCHHHHGKWHCHCGHHGHHGDYGDRPADQGWYGSTRNLEGRGILD